jgi:hypothetical protein
LNRNERNKEQKEKTRTGLTIPRGCIYIQNVRSVSTFLPIQFGTEHLSAEETIDFVMSLLTIIPEVLVHGFGCEGTVAE